MNATGNGQPTTPRGRVLVVDDEPLKRITLQIELSEHGYEVFEAADAATGCRIFDMQPVDVVVSDVRMPGMGGLDFLTHVKRARPEVGVILMTAYATVDNAVLAIKRGAHDYITKPFTTQELLAKLDQWFASRPPSDDHARHGSGDGSAEPVLSAAAHGTAAASANTDAMHARAARTMDGVAHAGGIRFTAAGVHALGELITTNAGMKRLFSQLRAAADLPGPLLLIGEAGVGKDAIATAVHRLGNRTNGPFITYDAADATADGASIELFGGEKHAAPGGRHKTGRIEAASGGTLLLNDVDQLPADVQARLLRLVERGEYERNGGDQPLRADVRLIATTRRDLPELAASGAFRADLYYRLNGLSVRIPPLRERPDDVPLLARHFAAVQALAGGGTATRVAPAYSNSAMEELARHRWPGNVRELEQVVQRAIVLLGGGGEIRPEHVLPLGLDRSADGRARTADALAAPLELSDAGDGQGLAETMADIERRMIVMALRQCGGNQARAAQRLAIPRTTLRDKMAKYGIAGA